MLTKHKLKKILWHQCYLQTQKQSQISKTNHRSLDLSTLSLQIETVHLFVDLLVEAQQKC